MTRVAAIDCGTNSIRLLVADVGDEGVLAEVRRSTEIVRLGQGVDRTGVLDPAALERTLAATARYAAVCADLGVERIRFVATSATRDARNRADFVAGVRELLGVEPEVVTGAEEAALSFRGAASVLARRNHPRPLLVVDIGGGSTELVLGAEAPEATVSLDVGSVRLTERHLRTDPPTETEIAAARVDVLAALAGAPVPVERARTLVGVAGSVTTVTAHALGLATYDRYRVDGAVLAPEAVLASCSALLHASRAERAAMGVVHPGRVDVIGAGALVWACVVEHVGARVAAGGGTLDSVVSSEHDILDGIALSMA